MKTSELIGVSLDWAVAKCEGHIRPDEGLYPAHQGRTFHPSTDWAQGGPIIERIKGFQFKHWLESQPDTCCEAHIHNYEGNWVEFGPAPLVAAMRCYVASKLGDDVEIPEELK